MTTQSNNGLSARLSSREKILSAVSANRGYFILLSISLVLAGLAAIIFPVASTLAVELTIGMIFLFVGAVHFIHAFGVRDWGGFVFELLSGLIFAGAGAMLLARPVEGTAVLTVLVGVSFLAGGIVRTIFSFAMDRVASWGWMFASGMMSILLGILILAKFPSTALWVLGVMIGINFLTAGWAFLMLAMAAQAEEPQVSTETKPT